jgi:hypothetical protein
LADAWDITTLRNHHCAVTAIASLRMLTGNLSPRALGLVVEWAQHQSELARNWDLAASGMPPRKIEPLA